MKLIIARVRRPNSRSRRRVHSYRRWCTPARHRRDFFHPERERYMAAHRIGLGIVGTGIAARELHWPALAKLSDLYEAVAVCNHNIDKARSFAQTVGGAPVVTDNYH